MTEVSSPTVRSDLPLVGNAWFNTPPLTLGREIERRQFDLNQRMKQACYREAGLDYEPVPYLDEWDAVDLVSPLDRGYAATRGYHPLEINLPPSRDIGPEFEAVYDECGRAANDEAFRISDAFVELSEEPTADLRSRLGRFATSEEGVAVTLRWAECMSEHGYDYAAPVEPMRQFGGREEIGSDEITVRLADLECDKTVGYTETQFAWEAAVVQEWTADHEAELTALAEEGVVVARQLSEAEARAASDG